MRTLMRRTGLALLLSLPLPLQAVQQPAATEIDVKAAYLYNFARFVEWPPRNSEAADEPFAICVLGRDPFGQTLDQTLANVSIRGVKVVARRITAAPDALTCRVLFISGSEERGVPAILSALGRADVLTVSDMPRFVQRGGMIQLSTGGGRVRFEVGLAAAQDAGLRLSSELLRVASAVRRERGPGE